ncbi:MAG: hypothetical protein RL318_2377 [Fibrobacterota bacterium]|jgi:hypothetical protein
MGKIHFIGGEKGGVGKSLVSRLLAQHMIDRELPFAGFDTDRSHASLLRYYADYSRLVEVGNVEALDGIVEAAAVNASQRVLVDLAAQTTPAISHWIEDSELVEVAKELGVSLVWWHVMDAGRDSVELLRSFLDRFGGRMQLVLVLNEIRGERFQLLEESGLDKRAFELGAKVLPLRKLNDDSMRKIDAQGASFWAAMNPVSQHNATLGLLERRRVRSWLERISEDFDRIGV